jgi:hypothetical protein
MKFMIVKRFNPFESPGIEKFQHLSWGALGVLLYLNSIEGKEVSSQQVADASPEPLAATQEFLEELAAENLIELLEGVA